MTETREIWNKLNKGRLVISALLGFFCAWGMNLSLAKYVTENNSPDLNQWDYVQIVIRAMYRSLPQNRLAVALEAVCLTILIYAALRIQLKVLEKVLILFYSLIFAVLQIFALSYLKRGSWELVFGTPLQDIRSMVRGLALTIICMSIVTLVYEIGRTLVLQKTVTYEKLTAKSLILMALLLFAAWLPYFLIFYPGTSNEDTVIQIMEYFSIKSYIQDMSPVQGEDIYFTNHHPYLLTQIFGWFVKLGLNLGDIRLGIALYTLLHMLFLAFVFAGSLQYLKHCGVSAKRVRIVQLFLMFFPIFPMYSVCMVKDTIYSGFCLLMMMMMFEVARTKGEVLGSWKFNLLLFADAAMMMLSKVYGMYIMIVVCVVYLVRYRRKFIHILVAIALPILLFKFVYTDQILPALNVAPGGIQEALSVPFQQTARYVTELPDEVTAKEKKAINAVLPYKKLARLYNPELSDPVKKRYNQEATDEELKEYFKVWWEMGKKHKGLYLQSILNNTYQYYYVNKTSSLGYYEFNTYLMDHDAEGQYAYLYVYHDDETSDLRYEIHQLVLAVQQIPVLNLFCSLGLLPWVIWFMVLWIIFTRRGQEIWAMLIPLLTLAICLVSPDNGNYRYVMPLIYGIPFLIPLLTLKKEDLPEGK